MAWASRAQARATVSAAGNIALAEAERIAADSGETRDPACVG
jgi:hypothetical protein